MAAVSALRIERTAPEQVSVSGELGFGEAASALARSADILGGADKGSVVTVDVAGVERVDSATLALLIAWSADAARRGARLAVTGASADLRSLAHLCSAERLIGLV